MKLLNKSKLLFVCFFLIALVVMVNIFNLMAVYKLVQLSPDSLSVSYLEISISDEKKSEEFWEKIKSYQGTVLLEKEINYRAQAVFFTNNCFEPIIVSGRNLEQKDFYSDEKIVLIEESLKEECIDIDGSVYYPYQNDMWKVVGIFKAQDNTINEDALCYFPFNIALSNDMVMKTGSYRLDMGEAFNEQLLLDVEATILIDNANRTMSEYIQMTIEEQRASVIALVLIIFMVMLNLLGVLKQWINGRKKLVRVMHIVGAGCGNIFITLVKQYYIVVVVAFILAIPVAVLMTYFDWSIFSAFEVSPKSIGISFFIFVCISLPGMIYILISTIRTSLHNGRVRI